MCACSAVAAPSAYRYGNGMVPLRASTVSDAPRVVLPPGLEADERDEETVEGAEAEAYLAALERGEEPAWPRSR